MANNSTVQRFKIADYINIGTTGVPVWAFCGAGFNTLDENPRAQVDMKTYINDKTATATVKSYQTSFPFDTDLMSNDAAIMKLYGIGRDESTGAEAEVEYVRVELFEAADGNKYPARKFTVAVEVNSISGAGGETVNVTGNLNSVGDFVDGTFDTVQKRFEVTGA